MGTVRRYPDRSFGATAGASASSPAVATDDMLAALIGFDVDLAKAAAQVLGLEAEMEISPLDTLVAGVTSGKYELGVSSFPINADRVKQVNMPSDFSAGTSWAVPSRARREDDGG